MLNQETDGNPLVTVVIPAFNASRFLASTLQSVNAQTYTQIECIVVDDGSTDDTLAIASSFPDVTSLKKANGGDASARNFGAHRARGEFIAFLDADDVWLPRKLELQMETLRKRPEVAMVYCGVHIVDEDLAFMGKMKASPGETALRNTLLFEKPYMTGIGSTCLIRRHAFTDVGGFDERLRASADWAFACKVAAQFRVEGLDLPLALYRQHGSGQVHRNLKAVEEDARTIYKEGFAEGGFIPVSLRSARRRGEANLMMSLAVGWWRNGERLRSVRFVLKAISLSPSRFLDAFRRRMLPPV